MHIVSRILRWTIQVMPISRFMATTFTELQIPLFYPLRSQIWNTLDFPLTPWRCVGWILTIMNAILSLKDHLMAPTLQPLARYQAGIFAMVPKTVAIMSIQIY